MQSMHIKQALIRPFSVTYFLMSGQMMYIFVCDMCGTDERPKGWGKASLNIYASVNRLNGFCQFSCLQLLCL